MTQFLVYIFSVVILSTQAAYAIPLPKNQRLLSTQALPMTFTADYNFAGIVKLNNCSGSLIQFEGASDSDLGVVLTNGHCYEGGFIQPGKFITNMPSTRRFELMNANGDIVGVFRAKEIIYATLTGTDITLYKLDKTYSEIKSQTQVSPLTLSSAHPEAGRSIEVISGYWSRGYSCQIEAFIPELHEGGWVWNDSLRYSRPGCEVIGGTSGSPVVDTVTRTVVAINNTGTEDGEACSLNNPCEIDENGKMGFYRGYSYAEQTYQIYTCLNEARQLDLTLPNCKLLH